MVRELTFFEARKCYKKKRNGVVHYVGKGSDRDTDLNYKRALGEWETKLAAMVTTEQKAMRSTEQGTLLAVAEAFNMIEGSDTLPSADAIRDVLRGTRHEGNEIEQRAVALLEKRHVGQYAEQVKAGTAVVPPVVHTVGKLVTRFVDHKLAQARTGQRSAGRYANVQSYLKSFQTFTGTDAPAGKLNADTLHDYYTYLLGLVGSGELKSISASDKLSAAKQFIRWVWGIGACELPKNIDSKEMSIARTLNDIKPMPEAILRERIKAARGRLKLELLLMANCGMTQIDTAEMKHTEVDWKRGTITRKRSKLEKQDRAPVVTYFLWPSTLELLRENASDHDVHVLVNRNGKAGTRKVINDDGTVSNNDNAASAYTRLQDRLAKDVQKRIEKMNKTQLAEGVAAGELIKGDGGKHIMLRWSLKTIRKCGASAIGNNKDFSRYAEYYLGDTPTSTTDRHYNRPSDEEFKKCQTWLGDHLQIDTAARIGPNEGTEE